LRVPAQLIGAFLTVVLHVYNEVVGLAREPATMAQTSNNERPTTAAGGAPAEVDASRRKPLPFGWLLFTAVWLLFPVGLVVQVLQTDLYPVQLLAFLASMAAFVAVFLWLMLRYPFPAAELAPQEF